MSTIAPQASQAVPEHRARLRRLLVPEMWASLAISVMWLVVLFDALWGPDILSQNGAGTNSASVPSCIVIALFAWLGTLAVARRGFGRRGDDGD